MQALTLGVGFHDKKKSSPIGPTLIGWVDYLDFWAEFKLSNLTNLDFLDFQ